MSAAARLQGDILPRPHSPGPDSVRGDGAVAELLEEQLVIDPTSMHAARSGSSATLGAGGPGPAGGAQSGTDVSDATWEFLANAAQMFERTAELSEVVDTDLGRGFDLQGYQWRGYEIQRRMYMSYRREVYPQYQGVPHDVKEVRRQSKCVDSSQKFFDFRRAVLGGQYRSEISHFQLRDLVWTTSSYDVFYAHADGVRLWNPMTGECRGVLDRAQMPSPFKLSSMCADQGIVFAGDYQGRYCISSLWGGADGNRQVVSGALSADDKNDIVNHATPAGGRSSSLQIVAAQNKGHVRSLDVGQLKVTDDAKFDWAVNCTAISESGALGCVVGDCIDGVLTDPRQAHRPVARLPGHYDFSFTCAISPDERLVATGNQDTSVRVYDVRWPQQAVATLGGYMGAMRMVKFSPCGQYLMAAEPADYVHVYAARDWEVAQDIEFLGEAAGAAFSPDGNCLFIGISDTMHEAGLAEFVRSDPPEDRDIWK
ncbi:hypothetical protein GGF46_000695 [Coemansia sp. RSA 552]|nr:hypothetical protein GGF46_000695 [Coemansia sp. RSA 552]